MDVHTFDGKHVYPMYHMKEWRTGQALTAELEPPSTPLSSKTLTGLPLPPPPLDLVG